MKGKRKKPFIFGEFLGAPVQSAHTAAAFCCLVPTGILLSAAAKLLSVFTWSDNYESYSFLLDHLAVISGFFSGLVFIFLAFAALRTVLDFMLKKALPPEISAGVGNSDGGAGVEESTLAHRRGTLKRLCGIFVHTLSFAYVITLGFWLFLLVRQNFAQYSPLQFYRYYREESFQYSLLAFFAVLGLGVCSVTLSVLFGRQKLLKTVSCAGVLHNIFQTFGAMGLCSAITIGIVRQTDTGITLVAECFITGCCIYFAGGLLRGLGRDILRGDTTRAFSYKPLLDLPEGIKIFDRNVSWEERTGLSFKSLWCLNYAIRMIPPLVLAGCAMLFFFGSMYTIEPHQEALLYRLGSLRPDAVKTPGLHFKLPWPVDIVKIYDVSRIKNMQIGYVPSTSLNYLWDSEHGGTEHTLLLGGGSEMVAVNMRISYRISNLYDYVTCYANGEDFLASGMYAMLMRKTVPSDLNTILGADRIILSRELTAGLSGYAEKYRLGIHINEVIIENIHPPIELAEVYHGVIDSAIQKETMITQARADAEKTINNALRQNEESVLSATARQTEKTSMARQEMAVYEHAFLAHDLSPENYTLLKTTNFYQYLIQHEHLYVFSPGTMGAMDRYMITNGLDFPIANQEL
jgi:membrane protease subunit HflK